MTGILTAKGEQKIASTFGGSTLNITTVRVGDGNGASITPNRLMTDLRRRVGTAYPVTLSTRDNDVPTMWRIRTEIPPEAGPFTVREIGVFDAAGDMIAIASYPDVEFLGAGGDIVSMLLDIVFPVSGQANISISVSSDVVVPLAHELRPQWLTINGVLNAPPASPMLGATYIIGSAPTGAWVGQAGVIAQWDGADWALAVAPIGHIVSDNSKAESDPLRFLKLTASGWVSAAATASAYGFTLDNIAPIGSLQMWLGGTIPSFYVKANGALLLRTAYPLLWAYAQNSNRIVTDAVWTAGPTNQAAFSTGDGATTFRIPDFRAMFFRGLDEGRGYDLSRDITKQQLGTPIAGEDTDAAPSVFGGNISHDIGVGKFYDQNSSGYELAKVYYSDSGVFTYTGYYNSFRISRPYNAVIIPIIRAL